MSDHEIGDECSAHILENDEPTYLAPNYSERVRIGVITGELGQLVAIGGLTRNGLHHLRQRLHRGDLSQVSDTTLVPAIESMRLEVDEALAKAAGVREHPTRVPMPEL